MTLKKAEIQDHAYFLMQKARLVAMDTPRLGKIHVSDLIKDCNRYVAYGKLIPPEFRTMTTEDMKSLYYGQVVHNNSQLVPEDRHEMFFAYNVEKKKSYTLKEALEIPEDDEEQLDIIYGSADDVLKLNGEYIISDKKTTGSIGYFTRPRGQPSESHVKQINCYRSLLKKCYDIDASYGTVIYVSNTISKEDRDKVHPMYFKLDNIEVTDKWMLDNHRIIKDFFMTGELPDRTRNYLCDGFCPHIKQCFGSYDETTQ